MYRPVTTPSTCYSAVETFMWCKELTPAHYVKYLGVLLDEHLKFVLSELGNIANHNTYLKNDLLLFICFPSSLRGRILGENKYRKLK